METNNSEMKNKLADLLMDSFMEFHESLEEDRGLCYVCESDTKAKELAEEIIDFLEQEQKVQTHGD
ncbi:MAG: hypothetical protein DWQ06_14210 [Calditrichaeota bacterium]|nr:MAG: hypothetical protein DWQ06_14210 [Calditrichota bacterium]